MIKKFYYRLKFTHRKTPYKEPKLSAVAKTCEKYWRETHRCLMFDDYESYENMTEMEWLKAVLDNALQYKHKISYCIRYELRPMEFAS